MGASRSSFAALDAGFVSDWEAAEERSRGTMPAGWRVHERATRLSGWTRSAGKRIFDVACVVAALPVALPLCLAIALAVWLTSGGPVIYRQRRMGRGGRTFSIFKFRTMPVQEPVLGPVLVRESGPEVEPELGPTSMRGELNLARSAARAGITAGSNQRFTPVGPFLRRWKLDELPQLLNILRGEMSLVGPRPKLPCYETESLTCRPGLTGFATMVFAREEWAMAEVPCAEVEAYYLEVVKPFKHRLDVEYMERATFISDLALIVRSVLRRWDDVALRSLPPWTPHVHGVAAATRMVMERPAMLGPEEELARR